jgi:hypothetical protein
MSTPAANWKQHVLPNRELPLATLHGVIAQNTEISVSKQQTKLSGF